MCVFSVCLPVCDMYPDICGVGGEIALLHRNAFLKGVNKSFWNRNTGSTIKHVRIGQINVQEIKMRSEDWVKPVAGLETI